MNIDYYWLFTELGILLEIVGALYIVLGSFQARMELNGFLFLSNGLIMQFMVGFG